MLSAVKWHPWQSNLHFFFCHLNCPCGSLNPLKFPPVITKLHSCIQFFQNGRISSSCNDYLHIVFFPNLPLPPVLASTKWLYCWSCFTWIRFHYCRAQLPKWLLPTLKLILNALPEASSFSFFSHFNFDFQCSSQTKKVSYCAGKLWLVSDKGNLAILKAGLIATS